MIIGRYVAATKAILSESEVMSAIRIERNLDGVVVDIVSLYDLPMESADTPYYSGLITPIIEEKNISVGVDLRTLVREKLSVEYDGPLLLWQNISLSDFCVTPSTTVRKL